LMPDFDFDAYNHDQPAETEHTDAPAAEIETPGSNGAPSNPADEVDKW